MSNEISNERLEEIAHCSDVTRLFAYEQRHMAKELLALRKAFSEPFCFTDDAGVSLQSYKINFECSPVKFGSKDIPLYRKPTESTT